MFKNIRIKMKGGKSRLQRVKVLASGKYKFVKNIGRKSSPSTRSKPSRRRKGGNVVRRYFKRRKRGGKSIQQQVFKWLRVGALLGPGIYEGSIQWEAGGGIPAVAAGVLKTYTGYSLIDGNWYPEFLMRGWGPFIAATAATYGIPKIASIIRRL